MIKDLNGNTIVVSPQAVAFIMKNEMMNAIKQVRNEDYKAVIGLREAKQAVEEYRDAMFPPVYVDCSYCNGSGRVRAPHFGMPNTSF